MKTKVNIAIITLCMIISVPVNAQNFWKNVGRFWGNVAEAAVVVSVDRAIEKYAPESAAKYRETTEQLNKRIERRTAEENAAWEEFREGRIQELRAEQRKNFDAETRKNIQQEIDDLNGVSPSFATHHNTSLAESLLYDCGIKQQNIRRGLEWNNAQNKYEKQNVAKDYLFDAAGKFTGNTELMEKFRQINEAQINYLSEKSQALTDEEKRAALNKRNLSYFDIGYDAYQEAKSRKSQYLAEKLNITEELMDAGLYEDTQFASEIAANVIAIQKSNLPEEEKAVLISSYGFNKSVEEIQQDALEVIAMDENVLASREMEKRQALIEERKIYERECQLKSLEERNRAIQEITKLVIPVFFFDKTDLTESQKEMLNNIADVLMKYNDLSLTIVGHACKIGYKNINLIKGLKRAENAKKYLVEKGISEDRIYVNSKGESEPKSEVNSENRRIEFFVK